MTKRKWQLTFDTLRPEQNGCHFADNIFKCIFVTWKWICFDPNFTEVCSWRSSRQQVLIGAGNALVPNFLMACESVSESEMRLIIQWNLSIMTTSCDTSLSPRAHPGGPGPPGWALEDRESDKMVNYLSPVCINHFTKWTTGNQLHYKGGRYWQVILYYVMLMALQKISHI